MRVCPECESYTSKAIWACNICGYKVSTNGTVKVAPSIPAARLARLLAEAAAKRMEDKAEAKMEATITVLRPVTTADIEIILNHLRIRHRETLSRSDYAELDAIIKRLEA